MKRLPDEPYEEYRLRRAADKAATKKHLQGYFRHLSTGRAQRSDGATVLGAGTYTKPRRKG